MSIPAAARLGDEIAHGWGVLSMVAGAVVGAVVGAAVVAATAATGGLALVIIAGAVAGGGLAMFQLAKGLSTIFSLPEPTTGILARGSPNVFINLKQGMRAGEDVSASCSGLPFNHPWWPAPVTIAEGSKTVTINGQPAARIGSMMVCGAHIKNGSQNVFIGGPTARVAFVFDLESWLHTGLEVLGIGAVLFGGPVAWVLAIAGGYGFSQLGKLGDRLGPGYSDLLQGIAGMGLLLSGPKLASMLKSETPLSPEELLAKAQRVEPEVTGKLSDLAEANGGRMEGLDYRFKSLESLTRKMDAEPGRPVNDVLRYTQIYDSENLGSGAKNTMASLEEAGYEKMKVSNTFQEGNAYMGINTVFKTPEGTPFELQFHTPESFNIKQNINHALYEQARVLSPDDPMVQQINDQMIQNSSTIKIPDNILNDIPNFKR